MAHDHDIGLLPSENQDDIKRIVARFETAWKDAVEHGKPYPSLEQHLPQSLLENTEFRTLLLHALVPIDLEHRLKQGLRRGLEHYYTIYKELGTAETLSAELIFEEYRIRAACGEQIALEDYRRRFPRQFAKVQELADNQSSAQPTPASMGITEAYAGPANPPAAGTANPGATAALEFEIGAEINGYELVGELGDGGFGEVWKARKQSTRKLFALKRSKSRTNSPDVQRIHKSLELFRDLQNPWLLLPLDWFEYGRRLCIVMELADGGSLKQRLEECRKAHFESDHEQSPAGLRGIPVQELLGYFDGIAAALDYLHNLKKPIQHRDIKAQNILLVGGYAKLADFDLAKEMSDLRDVTHTRGGTLAYQAPEMFSGDFVKSKSDQYCFAYTYAELRLGKLPFDYRTEKQLRIAHETETPNLELLGPAEREVLLRALAKKPDERFASCAQFVRELRVAIGRDEHWLDEWPRPPQTSLGIPTPAAQTPRQAAEVDQHNKTPVHPAKPRYEGPPVHQTPKKVEPPSPQVTPAKPPASVPPRGLQATPPKQAKPGLTPKEQDSPRHRNWDATTPSEPVLEFGPGVIVNGYELQGDKALGDGTYGDVWKAFNQKTGNSVAIKRSKSSIGSKDVEKVRKSLELFQRKKLKHPGLLLPVEWWEYGPRLCIVMDLADGGNLKEQLAAFKGRKPPGIPLDDLIEHFSGLADALDYLHDHDVQHRDIKPANILLVNGTAKLADFDLAKEMDHYQTKTHVGTPLYQAPEMFRGEFINRKSDLYCFAYTYAELRLGKLPFNYKTQGELFDAHVTKEPPLDPIPSAEKLVIHRALAKDPQERFETCTQFVQELRRAIEEDQQTLHRGHRKDPGSINIKAGKVQPPEVQEKPKVGKKDKPPAQVIMPAPVAEPSPQPTGDDSVWPSPGLRRRGRRSPWRKVFAAAVAIVLVVPIVLGIVAIATRPPAPPTNVGDPPKPAPENPPVIAFDSASFQKQIEKKIAVSNDFPAIFQEIADEHRLSADERRVTESFAFENLKARIKAKKNKYEALGEYKVPEAFRIATNHQTPIRNIARVAYLEHAQNLNKEAESLLPASPELATTMLAPLEKLPGDFKEKYSQSLEDAVFFQALAMRQLAQAIVSYDKKSTPKWLEDANRELEPINAQHLPDGLKGEHQGLGSLVAARSLNPAKLVENLENKIVGENRLAEAWEVLKSTQNEKHLLTDGSLTKLEKVRSDSKGDFDRIVAKFIEWEVREGQWPGKETEWVRRAEWCDKTNDKTIWVQAGKLECLIALGKKPGEWIAPKDKLPDAKTNKPEQKAALAFAGYVQALALREANKPHVAASLILDLGGRTPSLPAEQRLAKAVTIVMESAKAHLEDGREKIKAARLTFPEYHKWKPAQEPQLLEYERCRRSLDKANEFLDKAKTNGLANASTPGFGELVAEVFLELSSTSLEMGNYYAIAPLPFKKENNAKILMIKHFNDAQREADLALQVATTNETKIMSNEAKGNAFEDLALFPEESPTENYKKAKAAFAAAQSLGSDRPATRTGKGRVLFNMASIFTSDQERKACWNEAEVELTAAIAQAKKANRPLDEIEPAYFLGRVYERRDGDYKKAIQQLREANETYQRFAKQGPINDYLALNAAGYAKNAISHGADLFGAWANEQISGLKTKDGKPDHPEKVRRLTQIIGKAPGPIESAAIVIKHVSLLASNQRDPKELEDNITKAGNAFVGMWSELLLGLELYLANNKLDKRTKKHLDDFLDSSKKAVVDNGGIEELISKRDFRACDEWHKLWFFYQAIAGFYEKDGHRARAAEIKKESEELKERTDRFMSKTGADQLLAGLHIGKQGWALAARPRWLGVWRLGL